jgi:hypothetical protein
MNIQLNLTIAEVNAVLQTLGQLPTNSGVYPLLVKIKTQAEEQIPEDQKAAPENTQE